MEQKKRALGRGLEQLFDTEVLDFNSFESNILESAKEDDIKQINFSNTSNLLVTSGTSTPNTIINEIVEYIKENIQ
jgi:4-hydroxy-3-methylbut-2-enyl diphosphate reductase IspH